MSEFAKAIVGYATQVQKQQQKVWEKNIQAWQARNKELDALFERLYEDNVSGKITDDRFVKLTSKYEDEQKDLTEKWSRFQRQLSVKTKKLSALIYS